MQIQRENSYPGLQVEVQQSRRSLGTTMADRNIWQRCLYHFSVYQQYLKSSRRNRRHPETVRANRKICETRLTQANQTLPAKRVILPTAAITCHLSFQCYWIKNWQAENIYSGCKSPGTPDLKIKFWRESTFSIFNIRKSGHPIHIKEIWERFDTSCSSPPSKIVLPIRVFMFITLNMFV